MNGTVGVPLILGDVGFGMTRIQIARFSIGQMVRHRDDAFRGVVMDVDHAYDGPPDQAGSVAADQPFYRVFTLGEDGGYLAYAAEAVLEGGDTLLPAGDEKRWFTTDAEGHHAPLDEQLH